MRGVVPFFIFALAAFTAPANAEQYREFGDYTVHYSVFTTDILSPAVAKSYRIPRSKNRALLNISVLKKVMGTTGKPVKARIEATAANLSAQLRHLDIRELTEPGAIYYLAETSVSDGEILKYTLNITPEGEANPFTFSFQQQFVTNY
ncbi:MAG: DUF4426 domain-containing protein [Gammaproteobacteria bacterium]